MVLVQEHPLRFGKNQCLTLLQNNMPDLLIILGEETRRPSIIMVVHDKETDYCTILHLFLSLGKGNNVLSWRYTQKASITREKLLQGFIQEETLQTAWGIFASLTDVIRSGKKQPGQPMDLTELQAHLMAITDHLRPYLTVRDLPMTEKFLETIRSLSLNHP